MMIEHVALYVSDLESAKKFFCTYFQATANAGYHNPNTDFRSYFLTFPEGSRLELMHKPDLQADLPNRFGYAHIAFSMGNREAVDTLTARLKADGYPIVSGPRTAGDGYYESCVQIFDGILLEITV